MTRLQSEWHRLFVPLGTPATADRADLIGPQGEVRALVMEVSHPADWSVLSKVWQGVQADWAWPAPGIAVSGHDGYQLWFSLAQAVPVAQGRAWLSALQKHYLGDVPAARVHLWPLPDALAPRGVRHALPIPTEPTTPGQWSALWRPTWPPCLSTRPGWTFLPTRRGRRTCCRAWSASQGPNGRQRRTDWPRRHPPQRPQRTFGPQRPDQPQRQRQRHRQRQRSGRPAIRTASCWRS